MTNYNILQLNAKDLSALKDIATELGLKVSNSVKKEQLIYDILDRQAETNAQRKAQVEKPTLDKKKNVRVQPTKAPKELIKPEKPVVEKVTTEKAATPEKVVKAKTEEAVTTVIEEKKPVQTKAVSDTPKAKKKKKPIAKEAKVATETTQETAEVISAAIPSPEVVAEPKTESTDAQTVQVEVPAQKKLRERFIKKPNLAKVEAQTVEAPIKEEIQSPVLVSLL